MSSTARAIRATLGSGADLTIRQGAQFLVLLVLARLLTPDDFGIIALLSVLVTIGIVVADAGLSTSLIQAKELGSRDLDTAFWISLATGGACTAVAVAASYPLAQLLHRPDLAGVAAFMSLAILATTLGQVHTAVLVRRAQFGRLAFVGLCSALVSGGFSVALALGGQGIWALATQVVVLPLTSSVLLWFTGAFTPRVHWSVEAARRLIFQGRWVLAANVTNVAFSRFQTILIGTFFGASALGNYQRADSTQQITADTTSVVVGRVAIPLFAESSHRRDLLRAGLRTGIRMVTAVNSPIMALLGALALPVLTAVFGPQWTNAADILTVLCIGALLWPLHVMAINVLYGTSRNREVFVLDLAKKAVAVAALLMGAAFGVLGVAWAQVVFSVVAVLINGRAVSRVTGLTTRQQIGEAAPSVSVAGGVGLAVWVTSRTWDASPWLELISLSLAGSVAYIALGYLFRVSAITDLIKHMKILNHGR